MTYRRVRDPLHDIIEFDDTELERVLWNVVEARPFQRLRRIKQLGFSDLVYPGASHSRFSHSVGVFHTARHLMEVPHRYGAKHTKEDQALAAALVHDLGHGPFSHAFETVGKRLGLKFADHEEMSDSLIRNGEIADILKELGSGFANDVADIIKKGGVRTIQHAVVSSQFDADRLDYIRRDRMMTGTQHAAIDFRWLIANLEIGSVASGVDETQLRSIETFVLGPKALYAAEAFVLGLFQLYPTVYFHKTTRGAEKLFVELLIRLVTLVRDESVEATGLPKEHPLVRFAMNPDSIDVALTLDDTIVWGALTLLAEAKDPLISEFAVRLRDRKLFKCRDIRADITLAIDPNNRETEDHVEEIDKCCATIEKKLFEWSREHDKDRPRILVDSAERSPYKSIDESKGPLDRIHIRTEVGLVDIKQRSNVVAALKTFKLFRAYFERLDRDAERAIERIVQGEIEACTKMP